MVNKAYSNRISEYAHENGGRVLILFLLFSLAIYEFIHSGYTTFTVVCISPILIIAVYALFRWKMAAFWALIIVNYFIQMKDCPLPSSVPKSIWDEMFELLLIALAIIDTRQKPHFERCVNLMLLAIIIWGAQCTLQ